jgi:hypothetical protein
MDTVGRAVMVRAIARRYQKRKAVLVGRHLGFRLYELPRARPVRWFRFLLMPPGMRTLKFGWNGERLNRTRDARGLERAGDVQFHQWLRSVLWQYKLHAPPRWGEKVPLADLLL